jgi:hypothetical protein
VGTGWAVLGYLERFSSFVSIPEFADFFFFFFLKRFEWVDA